MSAPPKLHFYIDIYNGRVNLSERKLNKYFPPRMTARERERIIIELLEKWKAEKDQK